MSYKRVHFANHNYVYEDPPPPSPSLTNSSIPSSSSPDPPSPPPEQFGYHPGVFQSSPPPYSRIHNSSLDAYDIPIPKPVQIHYLLAYQPYTEPPLIYDFSYPPTSITGLFNPATLHEPATSPAQQKLTIICPLLQDEIEVTPSSTLPDASVTVLDILNTVHRRLRHQISHGEYSALPEGEIRNSVDRAYYARCARVGDMEARRREEGKGIKKLDLLMGKNYFSGLSGTLSGPDVWELNVS
ncbi:hypothetical protein CVT24_007058 [Panaeolus cyanescens]|uniref:DUF6699 domain-containing protein n=1 Tax=Panaeolus cyanescens TaxID=181874 RepID=A0A409VJQ0_9AGAR|nr:hypothetical protein CVT24_007058 [Panaeolus cyanescens]